MGKAHTTRHRHALARAALICCALTPIMLATLRAGAASTSRQSVWCIACGEGGTLDVILNVALFAPLGSVLALRGNGDTRRLLQAMLWSLALSIAIELSQLTWVVGRDPALSDVIANTLGGALGAALVIVLPRLAGATRRTWLAFTMIWALAAAGVMALGSWAMRFGIPIETHYIQWEPQRPNYAPFDGRLLALWLNERPLLPGEVLTPAQLPVGYVSGSLTIKGVVTLRSESDRIALIARVAHVSGELWMIGAFGDSFVARYRSNAHRIGLRSPIFALADAFHSSAIDTIQLHARGGVVELESRSGALVRRTIHSVSAARFWTAFLPFERAVGSWGIVADGIWLTLLFGPVALGAMRVARRRA